VGGRAGGAPLNGRRDESSALLDCRVEPRRCWAVSGELIRPETRQAEIGSSFFSIFFSENANKMLANKMLANKKLANKRELEYFSCLHFLTFTLFENSHV